MSSWLAFILGILTGQAVLITVVALVSMGGDDDEI